MVRTWFGHGLDMVRTWLGHGWLGHGLGTVWTRFGHGIEIPQMAAVFVWRGLGGALAALKQRKGVAAHLSLACLYSRVDTEGVSDIESCPCQRDATLRLISVECHQRHSRGLKCS